ncbi:MAG: hypothetical protein ACI8RD_002007 [Bacillariaceae sp.]|jgi:hypothetical protein
MGSREEEISYLGEENESELFQVLNNNHDEDSVNRKKNSLHTGTNSTSISTDNIHNDSVIRRRPSPIVRHDERLPSPPIRTQVGNQSTIQIEKAQNFRSPLYSSPLLQDMNPMADNDFETEQLATMGSTTSHYFDEPNASLSTHCIKSKGNVKRPTVSSEDKSAVILRNARLKRLSYKNSKHHSTPDTKQTVLEKKGNPITKGIDLAHGSSPIRQSFHKQSLFVLPDQQAHKSSTSTENNSSQRYEIDRTIISTLNNSNNSREDTKGFFHSLMCEDDGGTDDDTSPSLEDDDSRAFPTRNQNQSFKRRRQILLRRKSTEDEQTLSHTSLGNVTNTKISGNDCTIRDQSEAVVLSEIKNSDSILNTSNTECKNSKPTQRNPASKISASSFVLINNNGKGRTSKCQIDLSYLKSEYSECLNLQAGKTGASSLHVQNTVIEDAYAVGESIATNENKCDCKNSCDNEVENQFSKILTTSDVESSSKEFGEMIPTKTERSTHNDKDSPMKKFIQDRQNLRYVVERSVTTNSGGAKSSGLKGKSKPVNDGNKTLEEQLEMMMTEKPLWQKALTQISLEGRVSMIEVKKSPSTVKACPINVPDLIVITSPNFHSENSDNEKERFGSKDDPKFWEDTIEQVNKNKESDSNDNRDIHEEYNVGSSVSKNADTPFEYFNCNPHKAVDERSKPIRKIKEDEVESWQRTESNIEHISSSQVSNISTQHFAAGDNLAGNHAANLETPQVSNIQRKHFSTGDDLCGNYVLQDSFGVTSYLSDSTTSDDDPTSSPPALPSASPSASSVESDDSDEDSSSKPPVPCEIIVIDHNFTAPSNLSEPNKVIMENEGVENLVQAQDEEPSEVITTDNSNNGCNKVSDNILGLSKFNASSYLSNMVNGRNNNKSNKSGENFMPQKTNSNAQCTLFNLNLTKRSNGLYPDGLKNILANPSHLFHCTGSVPDSNISSPRETALEDTALGIGDSIQNR